MSLGRVIWNRHAPDATADHGLAPGAFLTLDTIDISAYTNVLHPRHAGEYGSIAAMGVSELLYPSTYQAMQFMAFFNADATSGLLVMTKDPDANVCEWLVDKVAETLELRSFGPDIPVETTAVSSRDEALDIYKAWARDQFWWAHGTKPRLKGYIATASYSPMTANSNAVDVVDAVGAGGIWHTNYRNHAFDVQYPDYAVASPANFATVNDSATGAGYIVVPYINSVLWDVNHVDYDTALLSLDENDEPHEYSETLHFACPYLESWQDRIVDACTQADFPDSGIYLDLLAATRPRICYASGHGHAPGSSVSYQIGLRAIAEQLQDLTVIVEGAAECYQHLANMMLAQQTDYGGRAWPVWLYVYGRKLAGATGYITAADAAGAMLTKMQTMSAAGVAPTLLFSLSADAQFLEAGYEAVIAYLQGLN